MKTLSRTVWILSLVSLLTDTASEMLYPIMPLYLRSIGFSILIIGVLEGLAEAVAGFSKGYFGSLSDKKGRRLPFIQWGYTISAISKPLMAFFITPLWIFFVRTSDRLGKGLRTGARDAVLSDEATPETKGRVFGFHRSMDTIGAVLGPVMALLFLQWHPLEYRTLFVIALAPGLLAVMCSLLLKEKAIILKPLKTPIKFFSFLAYWKISPVLYRKVTMGLLIFTLFNSSDVFLLLKAKQAGLDDGNIIKIYIFYNLVYAMSAFPIGILGDKFGLKKMIISGLLIFVIVYTGMAFAKDLFQFYMLFFLYGIYAAATEGTSKAWITNISAKQDTATAIGTYSAFQSICAMLASSLAGFLWFTLGAGSTFIISAAMVLLVVLYMGLFLRRPKRSNLA